MSELRILNMDEIVDEEVGWHLDIYVPFGRLSIVHGDSDENKML